MLRTVLLRPILALALSLALAPALWAQGPLAFDATTFDFGEIAEGAEATTTFAFTNAGTTPLRLVEVQPSCGCTAPNWSRDAIAPGESGTITVAYDSEGRPGSFARGILVRAEDDAGALEPVTLTITGRVTVTQLAGGPQQGSLMFDTDAHDFGLVSPGRVVHTFLVQNHGDRPVRLSSATVYGGTVEVMLPETPLFAGDLREIHVAVDTTTITRETFDVAIVLDSTDETQPKKSLRLTGQMAMGE